MLRKMFLMVVACVFLIAAPVWAADPVLSNGDWDPDETDLFEFTGYDEPYYASAILWDVCDEDNDLLPDGVVYILVAGTDQSFVTAPYIPWSDLHNPPDSDLSDVDDCENPVTAGLSILFAPQSDPSFTPPGEYCADIEATDSEGNLSNKLENLCLVHNPSADDDDVTDDDVTDDDVADDDVADDDVADDDDDDFDDDDDDWIDPDDSDDDDDNDDGCG